MVHTVTKHSTNREQRVSNRGYKRRRRVGTEGDKEDRGDEPITYRMSFTVKSVPRT